MLREVRGLMAPPEAERRETRSSLQVICVCRSLGLPGRGEPSQMAPRVWGWGGPSLKKLSHDPRAHLPAGPPSLLPQLRPGLHLSPSGAPPGSGPTGQREPCQMETGASDPQHVPTPGHTATLHGTTPTPTPASHPRGRLFVPPRGGLPRPAQGAPRGLRGVTWNLLLTEQGCPD